MCPCDAGIPRGCGWQGRRVGKGVCHLLHAVARSHKLACRSSFGSELLAACGAADGLQAFLLTMHEMINGPDSPREARRLREEGGYAVPAELVVDGKPVIYRKLPRKVLLEIRRLWTECHPKKVKS